MGPLLTFIGGPIFGAIFGALKGMWAKKQEDKVREREIESKDYAIKHNQFKEYQAQIDAGPVVPSYRMRIIGVCILSFALNNTIGIVWFLLGGTEPVFTWSPEPDTFNISFLFDTFAYSESQKQVHALSSTGVAMYLIGIQNSIMAQFISGEVIKSFRK